MRFLARISKKEGMKMNLRSRLEEGSDYSPTISDYSDLLYAAERRFNITRDEARDRYGNFTYAQWKELLKEDNDGQEKRMG
jgi:hypothetical protein